MKKNLVWTLTFDDDGELNCSIGNYNSECQHLSLSPEETYRLFRVRRIAFWVI